MRSHASDSVRLACGDHEIDLWLANYREIAPPELLGNLRVLLSDAERKQELRFHFADDRLRYLVTRAMVRTVLSRYAAVMPDEWEFIQNDYGRPGLAPRHNTPDLRFNISHTRGLIALAVSTKRALGVDVEHAVTRPASNDIARQFFSASEVAALDGLPPERRQERFLEYWTFKESYTKARGMGLALPLDRFSFHFPGARAVQIAFDDDFDDDPQRWCFWQCRPLPGYLLALCAERSKGVVPAITVRTVLPLVAESPIDIEWLRTT